MVQRKTYQPTKSYNLPPETRSGQDHLGPEMMMMKRTKPKRKLSGKPQETPQKKNDLVVKVTGGSPNYMKDTSSSEARKENKKKKNQNSPKPRVVRVLTKAPSFKRSSQRAATCSSTLKDSKFPEYLMLNHGGTHEHGTSVLRVCPYTYCSLNGHLQYPPLKSFISSRRRSLKSQKSVKMEASKDYLVEMYVEEKKECENVKEGTFEVKIETQTSETISEGAPCSETGFDDYYYSDGLEMVNISECGHRVESKDSYLEENFVEDDVVTETDETEQPPCYEASSDENSDSSEMVFSEGDYGIELKESDLEETMVDESVKEKVQEKANNDGKAIFEVIGMIKNSEAYTASEDEETLNNKAEEDCKEETQDRTEVISTIEEEASKVPFNRTRKQNQEEESATISWTINRKIPVVETDDLKEFNPKEPNYLPIVLDEDTEKVNLKHQDIDERKNSEDWMFDYALQRTVTKLSSARKKKVALLVEAFETVQPINGRHLQACN